MSLLKDYKTQTLHNVQFSVLIREEKTYTLKRREVGKKTKGKYLGVISLVSKKQVDALKVWEEQHPNWKASEEQTETYMELVK